MQGLECFAVPCALLSDYPDASSHRVPLEYENRADDVKERSISLRARLTGELRIGPKDSMPDMRCRESNPSQYNALWLRSTIEVIPSSIGH